jgi:hypothetical protein
MHGRAAGRVVAPAAEEVASLRACGAQPPCFNPLPRAAPGSEGGGRQQGGAHAAHPPPAGTKCPSQARLLRTDVLFQLISCPAAFLPCCFPDRPSQQHPALPLAPTACEDLLLVATSASGFELTRRYALSTHSLYRDMPYQHSETNCIPGYLHQPISFVSTQPTNCLLPFGTSQATSSCSLLSTQALQRNICIDIHALMHRVPTRVVPGVGIREGPAANQRHTASGSTSSSSTAAMWALQLDFASWLM